jgi:hypothetical protein
MSEFKEFVVENTESGEDDYDFATVGQGIKSRSNRADTFSCMYVLLNSMNTRSLSFEYVKALYVDDSDFAEIYNACGHSTFGYLFKEIDCVLASSLHELLVREAHRGGLMGYFGVAKTLNVLHEHFYWPKMKRDVQRIVNKKHCL